jgi:hypothetical protein
MDRQCQRFKIRDMEWRSIPVEERAKADDSVWVVTCFVTRKGSRWQKAGPKTGRRTFELSVWPFGFSPPG